MRSKQQGKSWLGVGSGRSLKAANARVPITSQCACGMIKAIAVSSHKQAEFGLGDACSPSKA